MYKEVWNVEKNVCWDMIPLGEKVLKDVNAQLSSYFSEKEQKVMYKVIFNDIDALYLQLNLNATLTVIYCTKFVKQTAMSGQILVLFKK